MLEKVNEAVEFIKSKTSVEPEYGVILGAGLGGLVNEIDLIHELNHDQIPHFPLSTVEFHSGKLIFGTLAGKSVVTMKGHFHYYEGYSMQQLTSPLRVLRLLRIKKLFASNAAAALNPAYEISDLMIIVC